jgi:hypothetical protein
VSFFYLVFAQFLLSFCSVFYCELMSIVIIITVNYCELFLLSFCLVFYCELMSIVIIITINYCELFFTQFLQRYTVSMFLYCEQQWWKGTHFYCELFLLSLGAFCASVDNNGGKAHVVSFMCMLSTCCRHSVLERHIFCAFF